MHVSGIPAFSLDLRVLRARHSVLSNIGRCRDEHDDPKESLLFVFNKDPAVVDTWRYSLTLCPRARLSKCVDACSSRRKVLTIPGAKLMQMTGALQGRSMGGAADLGAPL
jgi:hypothetical protein